MVKYHRWLRNRQMELVTMMRCKSRRYLYKMVMRAAEKDNMLIGLSWVTSILISRLWPRFFMLLKIVSLCPRSRTSNCAVSCWHLLQILSSTFCLIDDSLILRSTCSRNTGSNLRRVTARKLVTSIVLTQVAPWSSPHQFTTKVGALQTTDHLCTSHLLQQQLEMDFQFWASLTGLMEIGIGTKEVAFYQAARGTSILILGEWWVMKTTNGGIKGPYRGGQAAIITGQPWKGCSWISPVRVT